MMRSSEVCSVNRTVLPAFLPRLETFCAVEIRRRPFPFKAAVSAMTVTFIQHKVLSKNPESSIME